MAWLSRAAEGFAVVRLFDTTFMLGTLLVVVAIGIGVVKRLIATAMAAVAR